MNWKNFKSKEAIILAVVVSILIGYLGYSNGPIEVKEIEIIKTVEIEVIKEKIVEHKDKEIVEKFNNEGVLIERKTKEISKKRTENLIDRINKKDSFKLREEKRPSNYLTLGIALKTGITSGPVYGGSASFIRSEFKNKVVDFLAPKIIGVSVYSDADWSARTEWVIYRW